MSKSYDEGYENTEGEIWTCTIDSAAETHSNYTQTEAYSVFGGPEDLIKTDLTVAQLNSSEFGITFKATAGADGAVVRVDSIKVRAIYRRPLTAIAKEARRPNALSSVAILGERFIVVGAAGRCLTSDDTGSTWDERTTGVLVDLWKVRNISNVLYAVGDNGALLTSTNGETWVRRNTGTDSPLRSITAKGTNIIVTGRSEIGLTSNDQQSWRPV